MGSQTNGAHGNCLIWENILVSITTLLRIMALSSKLYFKRKLVCEAVQWSSLEWPALHIGKNTIIPGQVIRSSFVLIEDLIQEKNFLSKKSFNGIFYSKIV